MLPLSGIVLAGAALCGSASLPHVAEVFYDDVGSDTDREFVEILNAGPRAVALDSVRLESGDGAGADRWTLRWTGTAADSITAGGRFVIGGALVTPAPDAIVSLNLQNGPDAVRLVWPDGTIEVVGYGEHEFPEYACGTPAEDVVSGFSLARIPDDARGGSNALDFRPARPSPGAANQPRVDVALEPGTLALLPERPEPGAASLLEGALRNRGRFDVTAHAGTLHVERSGIPLATTPVPPHAIAPGETLHFALPLPGLDAGRHRLIVGSRVPGDEAPGNDVDSVTFRVGPGPVEVTEIQFHPEAGEGEWVEVANRSGGPLDLAGLTLSDRTGSPAPPRPPGEAAPLAPDSFAVFAQDREQLLAYYPGIDGRRVWEVAPWGALNNSNDASGIADAVIVREADGVLSDRVDYSSTGVPDGVPLEKRQGGWWPALQASGSPLLPPIVPPPLRGHFQLTPRRITDARQIVRIEWDVVWPRATASLSVYDLAGRIVARPFTRIEVPARGRRTWRPDHLRAGVYILALEIEPADRSERVVATQPLRIVANAP